MVGEHAAGREAIEHNGPGVVAHLAVDQVAGDLDPFVVGVVFVLGGDLGAPVAGHVDGDEVEARGVQGHAEEEGHLAAVGADAVVEDEADLGGRVGPSVEVEGVSAVRPELFDGGVLGREVQPAGEMGLDVSPGLLVGVGGW